MQRLGALLLAVVGYATMALFSPEAATLPAGIAFTLGACLLVTRRAEPRDEAERVAYELVRGRGKIPLKGFTHARRTASY